MPASNLINHDLRKSQVGVSFSYHPSTEPIEQLNTSNSFSLFSVKSTAQRLLKMSQEGNHSDCSRILLDLSMLVPRVPLVWIDGGVIKILLQKLGDFKYVSDVPRIVMLLGFLAQQNVFKDVLIEEEVIHKLLQKIETDKLNQIDISQFVTGFHRLKLFTSESYQGKEINSVVLSLTRKMIKPTPRNFQIELKKILNELGFDDVQLEFLIRGYFVDVCLPKQKIIIELDGCHHYSDCGFLRSKDISRDTVLEKSGFTIFRIPNENLQLNTFKKDFLSALLRIKTKSSLTQEERKTGNLNLAVN